VVVVNAGSALWCISRKAAYNTMFVAVETHAKACVCVGLVHTSSSMKERPLYVGHVLVNHGHHVVRLSSK
jgi:hypothetical protein